MALEKDKLSQIPQDAVVLTEEKALIYLSRILNQWPDKSDTFGYRYGSHLLAIGTLLTGIYANNSFRRKFKLMNYGRISSYLPISVVPAAMSALVHQNMVTRNIILHKGECPVCIETRSAALQVTTGWLLPMILAPIMSLSLVHRFHTYDLPYISKEPLKVVKIIWNHFQKIKNVGFGIFLGQAVVGGLVTYIEFKSVNKVHNKLLEAEKNAEFSS